MWLYLPISLSTIMPVLETVTPVAGDLVTCLKLLRAERELRDVRPMEPELVFSSINCFFCSSLISSSLSLSIKELLCAPCRISSSWSTMFTMSNGVPWLAYFLKTDPLADFDGDFRDEICENSARREWLKLCLTGTSVQLSCSRCVASSSNLK